MAFSRRSAQSCSCHGTCAEATAGSSPMRANEAINAPPRAHKIGGSKQGRPNPPLSLPLTTCAACDLQRSTKEEAENSSSGTISDYRRLDAEGQRVRCLVVNEELSNRNSCRGFESPLNQNP